MPKYCCFICPSKDYSDKALDDPCPICGRPYGFPLKRHPTNIREYRVKEPGRRGFYAATYIGERGHLNKRYILKVSPVEVYRSFGKVFREECETHRVVSQDTEHIVSIEDYFDETLSFGDVEVLCHVAVMEYIEGESLSEFILSSGGIAASSVAQVAIDLVRIWRELTNKHVYHNDLHAENIIIQHLRPDARRAEALDEGIRAVAIDLGSVGDRSKSDPAEARLGDQHWLARHMQSLGERIRQARTNIDSLTDIDNRLAGALEKIAYFLSPSPSAGRIPSPDQLIRMVKDEFTRVRSPWQEAPKFERFDDSYNALALEPWFVPFLLVDPDGQWVRRIAKSGPMVVIGMRGCGKTMLLRALEFHARATRSNNAKERASNRKLDGDRFVGLFVSCTRLLTTPGSTTVLAPFERLFCAYCIEAIRSVRHLQELRREAVYPIYYEGLAEVVSLHMQNSFDPQNIHSDHELERELLALSASLTKGAPGASLKSSPADAFNALAEAIRKCSPEWNSAKIFFLLDDVSTRFLREQVIGPLFSSLLFQSYTCAFKLSTEAQTLEIALQSPGLVERARAGRDYEVFDLGAEVYEKTKERRRRGAKLFVEEVLEQRAKYYPNHPKLSPTAILGDRSLIEIARRITSTPENSRDRKGIYHGISALSAVCVGDIGDVIRLYELMLRRGSGRAYPIPDSVQSDCFQDFCSRLLYELNRRESDLKDFALSFAQASYELLMKSQQEDGNRLRQYSSVYVRVTTGDTAAQFTRLRELVDAGVFVLHGGTRRTKTRDADPIHQFKLTFRRLFGLSNFIGLSERDRFELSGSQVEEWLAHPDKGKEILLRNLGGGLTDHESDNDTESEIPLSSSPVSAAPEEPMQNSLPFDAPPVLKDVFSPQSLSEAIPRQPPKRLLRVREILGQDLNNLSVDTAIIGLGFEERTLESIKRLLSHFLPKRIVAVEYQEKGQSEAIAAAVSAKSVRLERIRYVDVRANGFRDLNGTLLVDVTGLAKPALFSAVRAALMSRGTLFVAHTQAAQYYPLDLDIANVLSAEQSGDQYRLLESLSHILTGEAAPYSIDGLLTTDVDESRRRALCTFASAKHQRLLSLLDYRDYDRIEIVVPFETSPRNKIARIAAEIAAWNFGSTSTQEIRSDDLLGVMNFLSERHASSYVNQGYNFEIGLTGSKLQAVACAAVSVEFKVAQCWYVRPAEFDYRRFTTGIGESRYFEVSRPQ